MARPRRTDRVFGKFAKKDKVFVGEIKGDRVLELGSASMMDVINGEIRHRARSHDLKDLSVHAPVDRPSKIICIGLNYRSHINEMKWEIPKKPIIFTKPSSAIIGPREKIVIPRAS